jgi:hypothetical protein
LPVVQLKIQLDSGVCVVTGTSTASTIFIVSGCEEFWIRRGPR